MTSIPTEQIGPNGSILYYLYDRQGSAIALTDSSGHVVARYAYTPYGSLTCGPFTHPGTSPNSPPCHSLPPAPPAACPPASTSAKAGPPPCLSRAISANHFLYDGQYQDTISGLYYLRARWYDPATGQFTSVDALVAITGEPYSYAGNDPANGSDPTGESQIKKTLKGIGTLVCNYSILDIILAGGFGVVGCTFTVIPSEVEKIWLLLQIIAAPSQNLLQRVVNLSQAAGIMLALLIASHSGQLCKKFPKSLGGYSSCNNTVVPDLLYSIGRCLGLVRECGINWLGALATAAKNNEALAISFNLVIWTDYFSGTVLNVTTPVMHPVKQASTANAAAEEYTACSVT